MAGKPAAIDPLEHECSVLCEYLVGSAAPVDVLGAYRRAHAIGSVGDRATSLLDRGLLRFAWIGSSCVRLADAYAALFARGSLLRRKIVLMVAILESRGQTAAVLDTATDGSRLGWLAYVGFRGLAALGQVAIAAVVIFPLMTWYRLSGGQKVERGRELPLPPG